MLITIIDVKQKADSNSEAHDHKDELRNIKQVMNLQSIPKIRLAKTKILGSMHSWRKSP